MGSARARAEGWSLLFPIPGCHSPPWLDAGSKRGLDAGARRWSPHGVAVCAHVHTRVCECLHVPVGSTCAAWLLLGLGCGAVAAGRPRDRQTPRGDADTRCLRLLLPVRYEWVLRVMPSLPGGRKGWSYFSS